MPFNFIAILIASISTLLFGFVWYHPKVFGTIWMKEAGLTEDELKKGNMLKIFALTIFYSFLLAFMMPTIVIHQMGAMGMVGGPDLITTAKPSYVAFMADYGTAFRTFKHGALHGFIASVFISLPIIAINGLFERKSWKYILIHSGYWMVVLTFMGAIICGWQ